MTEPAQRRHFLGLNAAAVAASLLPDVARAQVQGSPSASASGVQRIVGLEEHFLTEDVYDAWRALDPRYQDVTLKRQATGTIARRLRDLSAERAGEMRRIGLDVQVLTLTAPGLQVLAPDTAVALQGPSNDMLAEVVRADPGRYQGMAALATPAPDAAARELERAVTRLGLNGAILFGRTRDVNLDDRRFWPIFEAAEALRAPLYLHPQSPVPAVRGALYGGFSEEVSDEFATAGIGWHYETGVQLLRLVLAGVFDRFPDLQVITGHWGEAVLFYLERVERLARPAGLRRPVSSYFASNVHVTPSGLYSERYLRWALEVIGPDRILFSTDYPYVPAPDGGARSFLERANLEPETRGRIASGSWDRLVARIRR